MVAGHDDVKTVVGVQTHSSEDRPCEEVNVKTTRENKEDNLRSVSALSLSSWHFFLCLADMVDSVFALPDIYLKSVVANKLWY